MSIQSVLLPVVIQIVLVFSLLGLMATRRLIAFRGGLDPQRFALTSEGYPADAQRAANCYGNQFEMPILFFLAVIFAIVLHQSGWLFVVLEWVFVAFRLAHAFVHTTSNILRIRGPLFIGSAIATALMWLLIFIGVFFGVVIA